jgi:hypothetical protein
VLLLQVTMHIIYRAEFECVRTLISVIISRLYKPEISSLRLSMEVHPSKYQPRMILPMELALIITTALICPAETPQ